jgi:hypothetical protein
MREERRVEDIGRGSEGEGGKDEKRKDLGSMRREKN